MIEFGGGKIGYPWHGLYRSAINKISTPAGGDVDLPGAGSPSDGSVMLLQVPGMPSVSTSAEDAAEGKTWLNYALLSGKTGLLYGREIGANQVIYIDSSARCWLISCHFSGGRDDGFVDVYFRWKRFGVFMGGTLPGWVTTETKRADIDVSAAYPEPGDGTWFEIQDVAVNGASLLIGVRRTTIGCCAVVEAVFSGSPADGTFDFSVSTLWDESDEAWPAGRTILSSTPVYIARLAIPRAADPQPAQFGVGGTGAEGFDSVGGVTMYWQSGVWYVDRVVHYEVFNTMPATPAGPFGYVDVNLVATTGASERRWSILGGARYSAVGVAEKITLEIAIESEVIAAPVIGLPPDGSTSLTTIGSGDDGESTVSFTKVERVVVDARTLSSAPSTYTLQRVQDWSFVRQHDTSALAPTGSAVVDEHTTDSAGLDYTALAVDKGSTGDSLQTSVGFGPGAVSLTYQWYQEQMRFMPVLPFYFSGIHRPANRVFSAVTNAFVPSSASASGGAYDSDLIFCPRVGVVSVITGYVQSAESDPAPFATEHPVTGEIVGSDTNVCWV